MKRKLFAIAALLLLASAVYSTERTALYRTHKVSIADVMVSCSNGDKPKVRTLENAPIVLVSCPIAVEHSPVQ